MKKIVFLLSCVCFSLSAKDVVQKSHRVDGNKKQVEEKKIAAKTDQPLVFIDRISAVIYTDTDPIILTASDFKRPSVNGVKQNKQDIIVSRIMDYEAQFVYKMPISDDAIDKYLNSLKEHHNLDESQLKMMFNKVGYSYEEGVDELRRMLSVDSLLNFKIKSRLVVTEEEARIYYAEHVSIEPTAYQIRKGFLPKDLLTDEQIQELTDTGKHNEKIEWTEPYWLAEDEIAESRQFITSLKEGEAQIEPLDDGYEVVQLIKKRVGSKKSFEESYKDIVEKLRMPLFEKVLKEYQDELLKKYEVVYLDQTRG